jgi:hypothetical protein
MVNRRALHLWIGLALPTAIIALVIASRIVLDHLGGPYF